ncbi:hypothetical protein V8F20_005206 [Naviculisporaceae sp. PSN 640]
MSGPARTSTDPRVVGEWHRFQHNGTHLYSYGYRRATAAQLRALYTPPPESAPEQAHKAWKQNSDAILTWEFLAAQLTHYHHWYDSKMKRQVLWNMLRSTVLVGSNPDAIHPYVERRERELKAEWVEKYGKASHVSSTAVTLDPGQTPTTKPDEQVPTATESQQVPTTMEVDGEAAMSSEAEKDEAVSDSVPAGRALGVRRSPTPEAEAVTSTMEVETHRFGAMDLDTEPESALHKVRHGRSLEGSRLSNSGSEPQEAAAASAPERSTVIITSAKEVGIASTTSQEQAEENAKSNQVTLPRGSRNSIPTKGLADSRHNTENIPSKGLADSRDNLPAKGMPVSHHNTQTKGLADSGDNMINTSTKGLAASRHNVQTNGMPNSRGITSMRGLADSRHNDQTNDKPDNRRNIPINGTPDGRQSIQTNSTRDSRRNVQTNGTNSTPDSRRNVQTNRPDSRRNVQTNSTPDSRHNVQTNSTPDNRHNVQTNSAPDSRRNVQTNGTPDNRRNIRAKGLADSRHNPDRR